VTSNARLAVAPFPSICDALPIDTTGALSSFTIVPTAVPEAIAALPGAERLTVKLSSGSLRVSPVSVTATACVTTPGANVTAPLAPV
jgi:hypothetical protein